MLRGVVCTPLELTKTADGSGFTTGSGLTKLDLNYFTLYWDKIVSPTSNFYHFCFSNEDDLIACGVLERPTYSTHDGRMHDSFFPEFYAAAQIDALQKREVDKEMLIGVCIFIMQKLLCRDVILLKKKL